MFEAIRRAKHFLPSSMEPEELIAKVPAKQEEPAAHDLSEMDAGELTEARHIAGELVRLHRDGAIRTQVSMRTCCATSVRPTPPGEQQGRDDPPGPVFADEQQRVRKGGQCSIYRYIVDGCLPNAAAILLVFAKVRSV
jgi:hypothetical protein